MNPSPTAGRSHLDPFFEGPRPWLVLARNAIPVIGVYALGWSTATAVFELWFDGMTALAAMLALQMRGFALSDPVAKVPADIPPELGQRLQFSVMGIACLVLLLLLGIPYWFALFFFNATIFPPGFWGRTLADPALIVALLYVLVSNVLEEFRRGYEHMSPAASRLEFNWDFSMHLARIGTMLFTAFFFGRYAILPLALALSYVEIYPLRTLRLIGGDRTLDAGNEQRSRD